MHLVISVNYSHLAIPLSEKAGTLINLLESAKVCKKEGCGNNAAFTVTDMPMIIHIIDDNRIISVPSKEYSALKDLSDMTTRAYNAEVERDKYKEELKALKLKFASYGGR